MNAHDTAGREQLARSGDVVGDVHNADGCGSCAIGACNGNAITGRCGNIDRAVRSSCGSPAVLGVLMEGPTF